MSTRAVATSIQAVSPLFGTGVAAAAPCARAAAAENATSAAPASPAFSEVYSFIAINSLVGRQPKGLVVALAGAEADRNLNGRDENLAIADLAGLGRGHN